MYKLLKNLIEMDDYSVQRFVTGGSKKLPDGYIKADYIESNGTQYIDTGLIGTDLSDSEIELTIKNNTTGLNEYNFNGAYQTGKITQMGTVATSDTTCRCTINFGFTVGAGTDGLDITKFHKLYAKNGLQKANNVQVGTESFGSLNEYPFLLFARTNLVETTAIIDFNKGSSISSFWVKKNGKYVRNLVPAVKKSNGNQLFDYTRTDGIIANKYINQSGALVSANDYYISYPISVVVGETYTWRFNADSSSTTHTAPTVGFYDINNNLIGTAQHAGQIKYFNFTVPSNCVYIRCSVYTVNNAQQQAMLNKGSTPLRYETYIPEQVGMYDLSATSRNLANLYGINKTALSLNFKTGDNMTIVVNGTKASGANVISIANPNIMLPAGTYTVKIKMIDGTISNITGGAIFGINASTYSMRTTPQINKVGDIGTRTFTLTEDTLLSSLDITPSYGDVGSVWDNATFECWLYSGSDDVPYEPYQKRFYTNDGTGEFGYEYNGEKKDPTS